MYRPQFAYPTPDNCFDQRFHYAYDQSNTPYLTTTLAAGAHTGRIPLQMDQDAPFFFLGLQQAGISGLQIRLETPHGEPLSDSGNVQETTNYVYPALYSQTDGAALVTLESDAWGIFCPRGGVLNLYLNNPTAAPIDLTGGQLTLHGKKRYPVEYCA